MTYPSLKLPSTHTQKCAYHISWGSPNPILTISIMIPQQISEIGCYKYLSFTKEMLMDLVPSPQTGKCQSLG